VVDCFKRPQTAVISFKILVLKLWVPPALSQSPAQQVSKVTFIPLSENFVPDLIYLGAAVARTLLKDGTFIPRAITRSPESAAALKLMAGGIEVVKADPLDKASLVGAMRGSDSRGSVCGTRTRVFLCQK
jgi:hypothetical protein